MGITTAWKIFRWVKTNSYDKVVDFIARYLLENEVTGPFLARHKRKFGFALTLIGLALLEARKFFPELVVLDQVIPLYVLFAGVILQGLGYVHAASKERRNIEYPIVRKPWKKTDA